MTDKITETEKAIRNFGINLCKIREERKMTREELADLIHLNSQRIIFDYENGVKTPSFKRVILISKVLNVSIDSMLL